MNLVKKIEEVVSNNKNKTFIKDILNNKIITYQEFLDNSLRLYNYFISKKITPGSRIILQMDNSVEYLYLVFACLLGKYVICPINTEIKGSRYIELKHILNSSIEIKKKNQLNFLKKKISLSNININKSPFIVIFTSGTTGEPKGIQISNFSYIMSAISFSKLAEYDQKTNLLHFLPMYYNAGLLNTFLSCFFAGSQITLINKISGRDIFYFWDNVLKNEITTLHLTPEIANSLNKLNISISKKKKISKIKIISTGSYIHQSIVDNFEKKYGTRILSCYGTTEAGGPLTIQNWEDTFVENSLGHHSKEVTFKVIKKNKIKYIYVKTPFMMDYYIDINGKKIKPNLKKGFIETGDIGYYKSKELFIFGRKKDIIKKGAEIVSLASIENVVLKYSSVEDVAAISKYDLEKGSIIFIFVKFKKVQNLFKEIIALEKHLIKNLKKIELPDKILPVPIIPKTFNGKTKKDFLEKVYT